MSNDIRQYKCAEGKGQDLYLTAYVGTNPNSIQFTIGNKYCCLEERALRDMIETINKRLNGDLGYTATGPDRNEEDVLYKTK